MNVRWVMRSVLGCGGGASLVLTGACIHRDHSLGDNKTTDGGMGDEVGFWESVPLNPKQAWTRTNLGSDKCEESHAIPHHPRGITQIVGGFPPGGGQKTT